MSDTKECPFCKEIVIATANECRFCGKFMEDHTRESMTGDFIGGDKVYGKKTSIRNNDSLATFIGDGTKIEINFGKDPRDEQYEIALNWHANSKPRMRGFDLSTRDLTYLDFPNADLRNANLEGADLTNTNLEGADLTNAKLVKTQLYWAKLGRANLVQADLTNANLIVADLSRANLQLANLLKANLFGACLVGAKLYTTNLKFSCLKSAKYDKDTIWPDGFDPETAGAILVDDNGKPINKEI